MSTAKEGVTRLDRWVHSTQDITLEGQTATATQKKTCNMYGEAVVAAGRAEWDIKLDFEGYGGVTVGLWRHNLRDKTNLTELPLENEQFVNFENGYGFTNKTGEFIQNKDRKTYSGTPWKRGSVLTMHLDLTSRTLSYSIDGKSVGLAKDCLPRGAYRLAAKLQFKEQKITIERFWTSLEDDGVPQIPNRVEEAKSNEKTETETEKETEKEKEKEKEKENEAAKNSSNDETKKKEDENNLNGNISTDVVADDNTKHKQEEEKDSGAKIQEKDSIAAIASSTVISRAVTDITAIEVNEDPNAKKQKHDRTYSLTEMRDQILQQKRDSGSWKDSLVKGLVNEEEAASPTMGGAGLNVVVSRSRTLSGAGASGPTPPINIPERVEVEEKDDDSTDTFVIAGNNLSCESDSVTCTKEAKGVRNSAFGAQVITHGRMDWMLRVEQGHSIRIGVSGVTHCTGEDYTDSQYGYGYGDDGSIYCHRSLIEWGEGFKSGDVIGIHLDMEKRTLRFSVNGNDHGIAFENLQTNDDQGVDGFRLAISLQYRPHQVKLLESTLYNTKQYSPRPSNFGNGNHSHNRGTSWFGHNKTSSDEFKFESGAEEDKAVNRKEDNSAAEKKVEEKETKEDASEVKTTNTNASPATGVSKVTDGKKQPSTRPTKTTNPKTTTNAKKVTDKNGSQSHKNDNKSNTKTQPKSKPVPKTGGTKITSKLAQPKRPPTRATSEVNATVAKTNGIKSKPEPAPKAPNKMASESLLLVRQSSAVDVKWKAPRATEDQFAFAGTQLRIDGNSCLAKNSIQDGNSALGLLEVVKDMKVEWTIRVTQGAQAAIGIMQTDESLKKNSAKYRKLLNTIFCTDRAGFGYFGKDGGVMKGGKYRKYGATYKAGDVVTVVLDMASNQVEFGKGGKSQGVAFSNIPTGSYRLAIMLPKKMHKVVIEKVQVWEVDK